MFDDEDHYAVAMSDFAQCYLGLKPPKRVSVSQGAAEILKIKRPGDAATPWAVERTPYMAEPMDMLASRSHEAVCFVGPAQSGKTLGLGEAWMSHVVANDPGDMLIVQMTESKAREYSRQRIDRALEHSPILKQLRGPAATNNLHDKGFRHGMWLKIGWPTASNLSSTSYRYVFLTDFDRMPENIDEEGDAFTLGRKRTTTFLSRGMTAVESSPGFPIIDPNWRPVTAHEAPPAKGILSIYNGSDRRRWYWKCPDCREWFEASPGLGLFNLPAEEELLEVVREADLTALATEHGRVVCRHCGSCIEFKWRHQLNLGGRWLQDGLKITADDEIFGSAINSTVAGYWLGGVAAGYQSWEALLTKYFQGLRDYALTGSEETLKGTVNTDQGVPYTSMLLKQAAKGSDDPASQKNDSIQKYAVPDWARFVIAAVDVQGGTNSRFIVQVHAIGPNFEQCPIDRYEIKMSNREGMGSEKAPIDPARYAEDWDILTERVVRSTYRTSVEGQELRVKLTVVDSGGEDGVTDKAYAWYRRVRREGLGQRVMLVKGASTKTAPMIKETLVGGRKPGEKGDVPLYLLNPNLIKDAVDNGWRRQVPGPNYIHKPGWLSAPFFDEMQAEVRLPNGTWMQVRKRNEAFDLCVYVRAGCLRLGADKIKWDAAPTWARPVFENSERITKEDRREMQANTPVNQVVTPLPDRPIRTRRTSRSSYLD